MNPYNGGKNGTGTYQQIINHIPPHDCFISLFAGHCGVFRNIKRAPISIINDIDKDVMNDWAYYELPGCERYLDYFQSTLFFTTDKPKVIFRNNDYRDILDRLKDNPGTFIYCDPPYPITSRRTPKNLYKYDWHGEKAHLEFLSLITTAKAMVMISSNLNDLYKNALSHWESHTYKNVSRVGLQDEVIYMNYPKPVILHDFQYLGNNSRTRQDIRRKVKQFRDKLATMPADQRAAILSDVINFYKETTKQLIKI